MPQIKPLYRSPSIATRKPEVDAIVELLESDDFDSAEKMARKVISTAFGLMAERDWWVVASRLDGGGPVTLYGFFATEGAALKALAQNSLALFGEATVYPVRGLSARTAEIERADARSDDCSTCSHPRIAHEWPRPRSRGLTFPHCVAARADGVCGCTTYFAPESDLWPLVAA